MKKTINGKVYNTKTAIHTKCEDYHTIRSMKDGIITTKTISYANKDSRLGENVYPFEYVVVKDAFTGKVISETITPMTVSEFKDMEKVYMDAHKAEIEADKNKVVGVGYGFTGGKMVYATKEEHKIINKWYQGETLTEAEAATMDNLKKKF